MSRFDGAPVEARMGECGCTPLPDGSVPHPDGDVAYLLPRLTFAGGEAAQDVMLSKAGTAIGLDPDTAEYGAVMRDVGRSLAEVYIRHQVTGWNLTNGIGPLPFSADLLLSDWEAASRVADAADDLYGSKVVGPLVATVQALLPAGPTDASTSPTRPSSRKHRKR